MGKVKEFAKRNWKPAAYVAGAWAGATALYALARALGPESNQAIEYAMRILPSVINGVAVGEGAARVYENETGKRLSLAKRAMIYGGMAVANEIYDNSTVAMVNGAPYMAGKGLESLTDAALVTAGATGFGALKDKLAKKQGYRLDQ